MAALDLHLPKINPRNFHTLMDKISASIAVAKGWNQDYYGELEDSDKESVSCSKEFNGKGRVKKDF
jgi:hypothetical protein